MANPSLQIGNSNWAIKEDNLLGYSTAGTRFVPQPITMTRASAGTRVNSSGLVETVELLGSEEVDCGNFECAVPLDYWTVYGDTEISNGKANLNSGTGAFANTLLQSSVVTNLKNYKISFTISNYQEGEAYVSIGFNTSFVVNADGDYTFYGISESGDNTNFLIRNGNSNFIGSVDNISVKEYITETNTPRLDYSTGAEAFLLEPQRTNLIINSSLGSPKTPYDGATNYLAPDGTNSAFTPLVSTTSNRFESTINGGTYVSGTELTYSWYRKRISTPLDPSFLGDLDVKSFVNATFSSTTQIASDISGYDRFSVKVTITDGSLESKIRAYYGALIGVGNSSVAYWGHQLELGSFGTSYIPTSGTTVTRNQELCNDATPVINSKEGVLYFEGSALADDGTNRYIAISDGTNNERIQIIYSSSAESIALSVVNLNSAQASHIETSISQTDLHKFAISYKQNNFNFWIDGVKVHSDTSGNTPIGLNNLSFNRPNNTSYFYGNTKGLKYYPKALADVELETLTSWSSFREMAEAQSYIVE